MKKLSFLKSSLMCVLILQNFISSPAMSAVTPNLTMSMGPLAGNNIRRTAAGVQAYIIKVVTNNNGITKGQLSAFSPSSNSAHRTMAISTLPNDFNVATTCKREGSSTVVINWSHANTYGACVLERNKTYYINIAHISKGAPTCPNSRGCDFYFAATADGAAIPGIPSTPTPTPTPPTIPTPKPTPTPPVVINDRYNLIFKWPVLNDNNTRRTAKGMDSFIFKTVTNIEAVTSGQISAFAPSSNGAYRIVAISKIPGDFNVANRCKSESSSVAVINWSHDRDVYGHCELQRNTIYYINISHRYNGATTCNNSNGCDFYFKATGY